MKMVVVAAAVSHDEDVKSYVTQAAFRKASRKMTLCFDAMKKAVSSLADIFTPERLAAAGLILNSGFGEIEATGGFLKGLAENGVARPIFFQNSLHNSTTGFLAIQYGIQGPVFTVNHRTRGGDEVLDISETLLADSLCEFCFAVTVETVPPEFSGPTGVDREGAAVLALCSEATAAKYGLKVLITPDDVLKESAHHPRIELPLTGLKSLFRYDLITRLADRLT